MKNYLFMMATIIALVFSGCSGGGGGSTSDNTIFNDTISSTLDDTVSNNSSSTTEITISANTINGIVDDDPVEAALVYIDFGDGTVSSNTMTASDGSYELKLSEEDLAKINPEVAEGVDGPRDNLLLIAKKDGKILRNALTRDVADGQTVYVTNDTEAYAQYLESIGKFDTVTLTEFNDELDKGRIKDDSEKAAFIKDIREDVKTYFYGGEKPTPNALFAKALTHLGKDKVATVADDSSYVSTRSVMSGGDIILPSDVNVTSDDITITSKGNGRYTLGDGSDSSQTIYLKVQSGDTFKLIPIEIKARVVTELATQTVTPQQGAAMGDSTTDSISAVIPPFALNTDENITFSKVESEGETADGKIILDMQPSGLAFDMPITVTINYSDFGIEDPNAVEWKYGSVEGGYENADIVSIDITNKLIYLNVSHFSNLTVVKKKLPLIIGKPFSTNKVVGYDFNHKNYINANSNGGHLGVDIMADAGTNVLAVCNGKIIKHSRHDADVLEIENNDGDYFYKVGDYDRDAMLNVSFELKCDENLEYDNLSVKYMHTKLTVDDGSRVEVGDQIGTILDWGTNSHLHIGFRNAEFTLDAFCIDKDLVTSSQDLEYENISTYYTIGYDNNGITETTKNANYIPVCDNQHYGLKWGFGVAVLYNTSDQIIKDFIMPEELLTEQNWIDPSALLGGTSLVEYDTNYFNSSLSQTGNKKYHAWYGKNTTPIKSKNYYSKSEIKSWAFPFDEFKQNPNNPYWFDVFKSDGTDLCYKPSEVNEGFNVCKDYTLDEFLNHADSKQIIELPLTNKANLYELYISNLSQNIRINFADFNTDDKHLVTSDLKYSINSQEFRKIYINSNDDSNGTSALNIEDGDSFQSEADLTQSKIFILPQIINIKKMEFSEAVTESDLFNGNENKIKMTPFVLNSNKTNVTNDLNSYGSDLLNLANSESVYFPLKHLGKHEFHIRVPNETNKNNLVCSYVKSSSESINLSISSMQSEPIYSYSNWYMLGDTSYTLSGNGYIKCTATADTQIDALYVKSIDYDENDMGEVNMFNKLSDILDEAHMKQKIRVTNTETGKFVEGVFNFRTQVKLKLKKEINKSLPLKIIISPIETLVESLSNRSLNSAASDDLGTKYKPQLQEITINAGEMSVNLPQVTLMPYSTKDEVKIRAIDATNGNVITDANVTVRFGLDRDDDTVVYSGVTDSNGYYSDTNIPYGQYSVILQKDGYISTSLNFTVDEDTPSSTDLSMSTALAEGQMRIRLSWGLNPGDLDSHLVKKTDDTINYHIYYSNDSDYTTGDNLDLDDTDGEGPETVTIQNLDGNALYTYYVHNYDGDHSGKIKDSGASVKISSGDTELTYYPPSEEGIYWKVFEIENGVIIPCTSNCMAGSESSMVRSVNNITTGEFDIFKNLPAK